jgi:hypothetical protein
MLGRPSPEHSKLVCEIRVPAAMSQSKTLPVLKRVEVQVLSRAGHTELDIAQLTGVSLRSIRRIEEEVRIGSLDGAALSSRRWIGRRFQDLVADELRQNPIRSSAEILRRARAEGYAGSKAVFFSLVARLRSTMGNPLATLVRLPGVVSRHELSEIDILFGDGTRTSVPFLASRLEFSRWTVVSLLPNKGIESLLRGLVDHFACFEGVPAVAMVEAAADSMFEGNLFGLGGESHFAFATAMLELGVCVQRLHNRRAANRRGLADRAKKSFFKSRRFSNWQHMSEQLTTWQDEVNRNLASRNRGIVPVAHVRQDRAHLRPLAIDGDDFAVRIPVMIGSTAELVYDGVRYPTSAGMGDTLATLHLFRNRVIIVAADRVVEHERRPPWSPVTRPHPAITASA